MPLTTRILFIINPFYTCQISHYNIIITSIFSTKQLQLQFMQKNPQLDLQLTAQGMGFALKARGGGGESTGLVSPAPPAVSQEHCLCVELCECVCIKL